MYLNYGSTKATSVTIYCSYATVVHLSQVFPFLPLPSQTHAMGLICHPSPLLGAPLGAPPTPEWGRETELGWDHPITHPDALGPSIPFFLLGKPWDAGVFHLLRSGRGKEMDWPPLNKTRMPISSQRQHPTAAAGYCSRSLCCNPEGSGFKPGQWRTICGLLQLYTIECVCLFLLNKQSSFLYAIFYVNLNYFFLQTHPLRS